MEPLRLLRNRLRLVGHDVGRRVRLAPPQEPLWDRLVCPVPSVDVVLVVPRHLPRVSNVAVAAKACDLLAEPRGAGVLVVAGWRLLGVLHPGTRRTSVPSRRAQTEDVLAVHDGDESSRLRSARVSVVSASSSKGCSVFRFPDERLRLAKSEVLLFLPVLRTRCL